MDYEITLSEYQGPLDKLLELIEERKMEITQISLAEVTADFLRYVEGLVKHSEAAPAGESAEKSGERGEFRISDAVNSSLLADFLVVASKLILIKSKILLPSLVMNEEEESDIKNLEFRLKIYQEFRHAKLDLRGIWNDHPQVGGREFLEGLGSVFYPPPGLEPAKLAAALSSIVLTFEKTFKPVGTIKREIINLKAKIEEVLRRITEKPTGLRELHGSRSRSELIVLFLAVLHLVKDQLIHVEQNEHFEEMMIAKKAQIS